MELLKLQSKAQECIENLDKKIRNLELKESESSKNPRSKEIAILSIIDKKIADDKIKAIIALKFVEKIKKDIEDAIKLEKKVNTEYNAEGDDKQFELRNNFAEIEYIKAVFPKVLSLMDGNIADKYDDIFKEIIRRKEDEKKKFDENDIKIREDDIQKMLAVAEESFINDWNRSEGAIFNLSTRLQSTVVKIMPIICIILTTSVIALPALFAITSYIAIAVFALSIALRLFNIRIKNDKFNMSEDKALSIVNKSLVGRMGYKLINGCNSIFNAFSSLLLLKEKGNVIADKSKAIKIHNDIPNDPANNSGNNPASNSTDDNANFLGFIEKAKFEKNAIEKIFRGEKAMMEAYERRSKILENKNDISDEEKEEGENVNRIKKDYLVGLIKSICKTDSNYNFDEIYDGFNTFYLRNGIVALSDICTTLNNTDDIQEKKRMIDEKVLSIINKENKAKVDKLISMQSTINMVMLGLFITAIFIPATMPVVFIGCYAIYALKIVISLTKKYQEKKHDIRISSGIDKLSIIAKIILDTLLDSIIGINNLRAATGERGNDVYENRKKLLGDKILFTDEDTVEKGIDRNTKYQNFIEKSAEIEMICDRVSEQVLKIDENIMSIEKLNLFIEENKNKEYSKIGERIKDIASETKNSKEVITNIHEELRKELIDNLNKLGAFSNDNSKNDSLKLSNNLDKSILTLNIFGKFLGEINKNIEQGRSKDIANKDK